MHPCTATALRRTAILAAALMASLTAHAVSEGHLALMTQAPLIWLGMLAMAVPCGAVRPVTEFRARSPILEKWAPKMDAVWQRFLALSPEVVRGGR